MNPVLQDAGCRMLYSVGNMSLCSNILHTIIVKVLSFIIKLHVTLDVNLVGWNCENNPNLIIVLQNNSYLYYSVCYDFLK